MFGFGVGSGNEEGDGLEIVDSSLPKTPPWLKKRKLSPEKSAIAAEVPECGPPELDIDLQPVPSNKHSQVIKTISLQLERYRIGRALKTMKMLPNFDRDFNQFVRDESCRQADNVLSSKDPPVSEFDMTALNSFNYEDELHKLETRVPVLMSSIAGTISASKADPVSLSRKGFGGRRRSEDVSLVPAMVQTASCILKNRHPNSISTIPCVNSVNNYLNHLTQQYFFMTNSLGLSFRSVI